MIEMDDWCDDWCDCGDVLYGFVRVYVYVGGDVWEVFVGCFVVMLSGELMIGVWWVKWRLGKLNCLNVVIMVFMVCDVLVC